MSVCKLCSYVDPNPTRYVERMYSDAEHRAEHERFAHLCVLCDESGAGVFETQAGLRPQRHLIGPQMFAANRILEQFRLAGFDWLNEPKPPRLADVMRSQGQAAPMQEMAVPDPNADDVAGVEAPPDGTALPSAQAIADVSEVAPVEASPAPSTVEPPADGA